MIVLDTDSIQLYHANCLELLRTFPSNIFDSCVTDPPYGLGVMNRDWDKKLPGVEIWSEILRVLKPGAHILACSGSRTYHRLTCSIEDAGFEIRDCLMWIYGSGFPKSHNVALGIDKMNGHGNRGRAIPTASTYQACDTECKNKLISNPVAPYEAHSPEAEPWIGYGTALKPAYEPIVLARKPFKGLVARNVLEYGVGCLNIDGCRVHCEDAQAGRTRHGGGIPGSSTSFELPDSKHESPAGRWPANIIHDGSDEVLALFPNDKKPLKPAYPGDRGAGVFEYNTQYTYDGPPSDNVNVGGGQINCQYQDSGSAARFFYCAKASKREREAGLAGRIPHLVDDGRQTPADNAYQRGKTLRQNTCPTVKPVALMKYLARLITPKKGDLILEPFAGSGTTALAAYLEGFQCVAIDADETHVDIACRRCEYVLNGGEI